MKVKLIYSYDYSVLDQFHLNMTLEDSIKHLKEKYVGEHICKDGILHFYVTHRKRG
ncbi:hypothetical protein [Terrisporobacter sp.]|uniref:hypothetical protein n=1 Tax=Terrisporobacter sp. TaxID=1965305 RepID=UPI002605DD7A|nr:hypothetical protein [Terrisporobacter sp.]